MSKNPKNKKPKIRATRNKAKDVVTKPVQPISIPPRQQADNMQALNFIDNCVALAPLGRSQHIQAQQALRQISGALGELDRLKKEKS